MSDVLVVPEAGKGPGSGGAAGAEAPGGPARLTLAERLSDRLNPILLREVQQALNGRAFLVTVWLALLGIVVVALTYASGGELERFAGRKAFTLALSLLTPLVGLVVPFIAFLSMRQEVSSGTVEHLLLSRLSPGAVVRGKLAAAVVQLVVVISLFAPLLALTWLLRGVDVRTIAVLLTLALLAGVAAVSVGICGGALCRWPPARAILVVILALGFSLVSLSASAAMRELVREVASGLSGPDFRWRPWLGALVPVGAGVGLLMLTASSALTHPHENRSTGFRLFALLSVATLYGWMAFMVLDARRGSASWRGSSGMDRLAPEIALGLAFATFFFWLFASTEEDRLSPRVRVHVPRSRALSLLVAPLLPGSGRGLLFVLLLAGVTLLGADRLPRWLDGIGPQERFFREACAAWAYVIFYAGLGRFLRGRMPAGPRGSVLARFALPLAILVLALLPVIVRLLFTGRGSAEWSAMDATNPFATLAAMETPYLLSHGATTLDPYPYAIYAPLGLAALALLVNLPGVVRGLGEVVAAAKARRARAS